ncbi:hypothetical protein [Ruminiclostridium sufflavum]
MSEKRRIESVPELYRIVVQSGHGI